MKFRPELPGCPHACFACNQWLPSPLPSPGHCAEQPYLAHRWCRSTPLGRNTLHAQGHTSHHSGTGSAGRKQPHRNREHKLQETSTDLIRTLTTMVSKALPCLHSQAGTGDGLPRGHKFSQVQVCALNKKHRLKVLPTKAIPGCAQTHWQKEKHSVAFPSAAPSWAATRHCQLLGRGSQSPPAADGGGEWKSALPSLQLLPVQPASQRHPAAQISTSINNREKTAGTQHQQFLGVPSSLPLPGHPQESNPASPAAGFKHAPAAAAQRSRTSS